MENIFFVKAVYTILTYILLPIAIILGFLTLMLLLAAFMYPMLLFNLFIIAGVVIYVFCCFIFLIKGLQPNKPCKPSLKDWIKVNAFVSMAFCAFMIYQAIGYFINPSQMINDDIVKRINEGNSEQIITKQNFKSAMTVVEIFIVVFAVILIVHIYYSFRFLNQRKDLFEPMDY